jgi:hypothetical protein
MVFDELADGPHTAIAEVVNIIHRTVPVLKLHKITDYLEDIFFPQGPLL